MSTRRTAVTGLSHILAHLLVEIHRYEGHARTFVLFFFLFFLNRVAVALSNICSTCSRVHHSLADYGHPDGFRLPVCLQAVGWLKEMQCLWTATKNRQNYSCLDACFNWFKRLCRRALIFFVPFYVLYATFHCICCFFKYCVCIAWTRFDINGSS